MPAPAGGRFHALVPMLQTMDVAGTAEWYVRVLGFEVVAHEASWCRLARDDVSLMFMQNAHLGTPHATATQYFHITDVSALWAHVKAHCPAEWGPEVMPYGLLEFAVRDPNGYLLSFGQPA